MGLKNEDVFYLHFKIGMSPPKKNHGTTDRQTLLNSLHSTIDLDLETIGKIQEKLGLTFVPEKGEAGNVCMVNSPEVRDEYKDTFATQDLLDYAYAVLHFPRYLEKYKNLSKIEVLEIPHPSDQNRFWKLARLGTRLRQLPQSEISSLEKYNSERTEIINHIAEIKIEDNF